MKTLYVLLLAWPLGVWAQSESLKPIETVTYSAPGYTQYGYRTQHSAQYLYDGIEVRRATDLGQYILASGDPDAIHEYRQFQTGRKLGTPLLIAGGAASLAGFIMTFSRIVALGRSDAHNALTSPTNSFFTNRQTVNTPDKQGPNKGGMILFVTGSTVAVVGSLLRMPGFHFRRSIQYYNKSLRTKDVSFRLEPHWNATNAGMGLVARF